MTTVSPATKHYAKRLGELLPRIGEGGDINMTTPESKGNTALHYACAVGDVELVQWLLSRGANVNAKTDKGKLPIECISGDASAELYNVLKEATFSAK